MLTEANGVPVGLAVAAANVPDMKLVAETLASVPVLVPGPEAGDQHVCLDKGYDFEVVQSEAEEAGYSAEILRRRPRGAKEAAPPDADPAAKEVLARRWVVERTHSWMNRFRRLLVRWEKKSANYLAMLNFACAYITY